MNVKSKSRASRAIVAAVSFLAAGLVPAYASTIISIVPVTVSAGVTGASFDVVITNNGPSAQNIASFAVAFSIGSTNITFTAANYSTSATYLFAGDSYDVNSSSSLATTLSPQFIQASDISDSLNGTNLAAGQTLGLAHVIFNVAGGTAPGTYQVALATNCTNGTGCTDLSDNAVVSVPFTTSNANITVRGIAATPEPATLALVLLAAPVVFWKRRTRV